MSSLPVQEPRRPEGCGYAKAQFVLGETTCFVVEDHPAVPRRECIGNLALGDRCYVVLAASDDLETRRPDIVNLLSPRELEIAFHVASGSNCKVVARRLRISFHTVRVHLGRIYAKLGLHKQTELAALVAAHFRGQSEFGPCPRYVELSPSARRGNGESIRAVRIPGYSEGRTDRETPDGL